MDLPDAIDAIQPSVVQVAYMEHLIPEAQQLARGLQSPGYNKPFGTGFFVNTDGFVVTAKHVVDEASLRLTQGPEAGGKHAVVVGLAWPNIDVNFRARFRATTFDVVAQDDTHDLAILRPRQNPFAGDIPPIVVGGETVHMPCAVPKLRQSRPRDGASIAVSGYPLEEFALVTNAGTVASSWAARLEDRGPPPEVTELYLGDLEINRGNSGGPVYLVEDASVVAVCISVRTTAVLASSGEVSAGLARLMPIQYVIDLLDQHGLAYDLA